MAKKDTTFGKDLMTSLHEVHAHRRGEIALPSRNSGVITVQRVAAGKMVIKCTGMH